jgi:hypothetical protein
VIAAAAIVVIAAAPMVEVWPYAVERQEGAFVYSYDLTPAKLAGPTPDAKAAHGAAATAFLRALPRTVQVAVPAKGALRLEAGRPLEQGSLSSTFAKVPRGRIASGNPLDDGSGAKLKPALHPDEPKLLASVDAVLWGARQLEEQATAALVTEIEKGAAPFWRTVARKALALASKGHGDAKDGALLLAARIAAADACLDSARLGDASRANTALAESVAAQLKELQLTLSAQLAPAALSWSQTTRCHWLRAQALAIPFADTRAGAAAPLTFLVLLEDDVALRAQREVLLRQQAAVLGSASEVVGYEAVAQGKAKWALENLGEFLGSLGPTRTSAPLGIWPAPQTPMSRFLSELKGSEAVGALEQWASAVSDARVDFDAANSHGPWPAQREKAPSMLLSDEGLSQVQLDGSWVQRLSSAFLSLSGGHMEPSDQSRDIAVSFEERSELKVRLQAPPMLEVEPMAKAYSEQAASLTQLVAVLEGEKGWAQVRGLQPRGTRRSQGLLVDAKRWAQLLRGLAKLSVGEGASTDADVVQARRWLSSWTGDEVFSFDGREVVGSPMTMGGERAWAAKVGIGRRELVASYASPVEASVLGDGASFVIGTLAEQRFIVPVWVTTEVTTHAQLPVMSAAAWQKLCDSARRVASECEAVLKEAVAVGSPAKVEAPRAQ